MIIEIDDSKVIDLVSLLKQYKETYSDDPEDKEENKEKLNLANELIKKCYKTN